MNRALLFACVLGACGGGGHHTSDASPYDAPADTLPISGDAGATGVTLLITTGGEPVANVATLFLDAQDRQVAAVTTDASGKASAIVGAGGSVTAVIAQGPDVDHLTTFTNVQPGDTLMLVLAPPGAAASAPITISAPTNAGADHYNLFPSCGMQAGSIDGQFSFTPVGCTGDTVDIVIASGNSQDDATISGFLVAQGLSAKSDNALSGTFSAPLAQQFAYTGIPNVLAALETRAVVLGANGPTYAGADTHALAANETSATTTAVMPDTSLPDEVATTLYPRDTELGEQTVYDVVTATNAPYSLDVSQAMLPRYIAAPAYDATSHSVGWGEAPGVVQPDLVRVRIHAYRDDIPSGRSWTWEIASTRNATTITFPTLPPLDGFSFMPVATDAVGVDELTTVSVPGGFGAVRTHPFDVPTSPLTSGRAVVETLYSPNL
jgi:hypothetical protein